MKSLLVILLLFPLLSFGIPRDKQLHLGAGTVISALSIEALHLLKVKKKTAVLVGFGAGCLAGIAKEIYDKKFDRKDCIATSIGSGIGVISMSFIIKL